MYNNKSAIEVSIKMPYRTFVINVPRTILLCE